MQKEGYIPVNPLQHRKAVASNPVKEVPPPTAPEPTEVDPGVRRFVPNYWLIGLVVVLVIVLTMLAWWFLIRDAKPQRPVGNAQPPAPAQPPVPQPVPAAAEENTEDLTALLARGRAIVDPQAPVNEPAVEQPPGPLPDETAEDEIMSLMTALPHDTSQESAPKESATKEKASPREVHASIANDESTAEEHVQAVTHAETPVTQLDPTLCQRVLKNGHQCKNKLGSCSKHGNSL